jgi:hypothetical protein
MITNKKTAKPKAANRAASDRHEKADGRAVSGSEFVAQCDQALRNLGFALFVEEDHDPAALVRANEALATALNLEPSDRPDPKKLVQLLRSANRRRRSVATLKGELRDERSQAQISSLEQTLSHLVVKFEQLDQTRRQGQSDRLPRPAGEVEKMAAELVQDIASLPLQERAKILEWLGKQLSISLPGPTSSRAIAGKAPAYPLIQSSDLLSETLRRRAPKQKWLKRDRSLKQTPVEFIRETYADRIGRGFTQADLKACDKSCYDALHQWLRKTDPLTGKQNRIPPNLDLPTVEDWNARRVRQLRTHPDSIDDEERQRLSYIIAGRTYRGNEIK